MACHLPLHLQEFLQVENNDNFMFKLTPLAPGGPAPPAIKKKPKKIPESKVIFDAMIKVVDERISMDKISSK
jgi:hypothetical protein